MLPPQKSSNSEFFQSVSINKQTNSLEIPCPSNEELAKIFEIAIQNFQSSDIHQIILGTNSLINFITLLKSNSEMCQLYSSIILQINFESLIQQLANHPNHPLLTKYILNLLTKLSSTIPQAVDAFLSADLHNILLSLMPSNDALKCIKKMFLVNKTYRDLLIENNFQKQILNFIDQLNLCPYIPNLSLLENDYISFLTKLQSYFTFDIEDYAHIADLFFKNIIAHRESETYAQESYIDFLLNSDDVNLMKVVCDRHEDVINVFIHYLRPAYGKVKSKVLRYFQKIIETAPEFAPLFINPSHIDRMLMTDNNLDKTESVVHFVFTLCNISQEICEQLITIDLFTSLVNMMITLPASLKIPICFIFCLLITKYPPTSEFYAYFNIPELLELCNDSFLECIQFILENDNSNKDVVLDMLMIIVKRAEIGNPDLFVNVCFQHMLNQSFFDAIFNLTTDEDESISQKASILYQKLEEQL